MNINSKTMKVLAGGVLALGLGACTGPTATERHFGESVRQMIRAQTYDPSTLESPPADPVDRTDGQMLEGVLESYRGDSGSRDAVGNDIVINVGGR